MATPIALKSRTSNLAVTAVAADWNHDDDDGELAAELAEDEAELAEGGLSS